MGGPKREYLADLSTEILEKLKLFVKSPNSVHNVGEERDKWVPNPKANSETDMDNFYRLGIVMALGLRTEECLSLNLPSVFWKYLQGTPLLWEDYKKVNVNQVVCLEKIKTMTSEDVEFLDEKMVTFLNDGQEFDLIPGGSKVKLTIANRVEFACKSSYVHLMQLEKVFRMIHKGFHDSIQTERTYLYSASDLEDILSGTDHIDIEVLKRLTVYEGFPGVKEQHNTVVWFWEILRSFSQQELAKYLRFVWGRTRLSPGLTDVHTIELSSKIDNIPQSYTCSFVLILSEYSSKEVMIRQLLYALNHCNIIAEDDAVLNFASDLFDI